jgi:hypothetical protein
MQIDVGSGGGEVTDVTNIERIGMCVVVAGRVRE